MLPRGFSGHVKVCSTSSLKIQYSNERGGINRLFKKVNVKIFFFPKAVKRFFNLYDRK